MATLDQAIEQMLGAGMPAFRDGHPVPDGKIHRYGPKAKSWYVLFEYRAKNGKQYVAGAFGRWQGLDNGKQLIQSDYSGMEPEERARLERSYVELQAREKARREERARNAANRALLQWKGARRSLPEGERCPYLERKLLGPEPGLRFFKDGTLIVPMVRYDVTEEQMQDPEYKGPPRLAGLQKIAPDGSKLFNKGMAKEGTACRLGSKPKDGDVLLVGEGLATMLTVRKALDREVVAYVAFDAGNLVAVARILRKLYPKSPIVFCADDDAYLEAQLNKQLRDGFGATEIYRCAEGARAVAARNGAIDVRGELHEDERGIQGLTAVVKVGEKVHTIGCANAGRTKAAAAAAEIGNAWIAWPNFSARELVPDPDVSKATDFNDLHAAEGLEVVREELRAWLKSVRAGSSTPASSGPAAAAGGSSGGDTEDNEYWALYWSLIRRYTLIYPSDTAFDALIGKIVKVEHMRNLFGRDLVKMWTESPKKRVVNVDNVVFDPTGRADPATTVNLFRGFKMKPSPAGSCTKQIELLQYLCGEEGQDEAPITDWVLNWVALPLQRPGAKMQTAVVMYGDEGTGKNMFWSAVRSIYGEHGTIISQMQLNSQFNDWLSARLFLIANEVVTRQEIRHHVGYLKNLITEPEVWINPKNIGARSESNHANLVFLSNELQPLQIGPGDRRYMIIRTPGAKAREYYEAVHAELAAGGAEALYQFLLERDIGEFREHTKPLDTSARQALIEIGMSAPQLFWRELHENALGLPYVPAITTDVYQAFVAWCSRNGEKMAPSLNKFKPAFMSLNGITAKRDRLLDPDADLHLVDELGVRQRTIFIMGAREATVDAERERVVRGVREFRAALKKYLMELSVSGQIEADRRRFG